MYQKMICGFIGTVTNTLGYALNNCMIYYQGNLLYIGDIEKGETIDVKQVCQVGYIQ